MTCLDEGRWIDLAAGRLRFRARRRAIRHLEACTECRRRYAEARAFVAEGLPGLAAAEGLRPRDPSALRARVFAAVERDRGARRPHRATRVAVLLAPLAAALLVAAVLGYRFLGERGWKPRLEELDGAILVASGGEDLSRLENRQAELRPGDLVLALPGAQGRLHLRDQRSLDIIGPAVLVVDFARVHLLRGIALARAPAGVPLLASAGEYDLRILGSAEIDAFAPDPLPVLQAARRLAADIQRDARPGRAVAAAAPPNGLSELRVHSLHGEVAFGAGLPVVDGGLVLTVSSGGPWPTPLRGGREPFFRSGDLTPRELDAVKLLLLRSPDPLRSLALCATDAALESWRRALAVRLTGELGDPRARPWLTDLFKDPGVPVVVRAATITCLALLDDTSLLAAALRDAEPAVAEAAATIAARLPGQTGQLAAISADDSIPPLARAIAAWALERSSEKVAADLLLSIASAARDGPAMRVAMELLSSREDPASTATLLAAARAGPPALRAAALGHVARRDEPEVAPIVLAAFAQHEPEEVREAALLALPWSATPEVLLSAAAEALEAPSPRLRSAAVRALTRRLSPPAPFREQRAGLLLSLFGRPDVPAADLVRVLSCVDPGEDRLRDLFLSASAPAVRGEALRHLASRYPASIDFDQILSAAEDPANPIRSAAYAALGHVWPGPTARRLLGPDAVFPPDQECLPALDAILASGREHECPVVLLVSGLLRIGANAPSPLFRRRALELLAQLGPLDPAGVAAAAIHILASPESSPLVRSAAIAVFLSVPVLDQAARGALGRALSDPDDIVADRAAEVLLRRPTSPIDRSLPQAVARARHAPDPALRADAVLRSVLLADSASLLREATRDPHPVVRFAALASDDTSLPGTLLTALEVCLREVPALGAPPAAANWLDGASSVSPLPAPGALAEEFVERLYALRAGPEQDFRHEESARLRENRERAVAGALRILDDPREGNGADALRDLSWAGGRSVLDYVQAACAAPDEATRAEALKALRRILGGRLTPVFAHTAFEELQDWWTDRAFSAPVPLFDLPSKHDR